jgi:hypothetical protein
MSKEWTNDTTAPTHDTGERESHRILTDTRFGLRTPSTHASKWTHPALVMTSLLAVLFVTGSVTNRAAAQTREPPSASPTGGEPLRLAGGVELTREHLAELTFRGPDPDDFAYTGG